MVHSFGKKAQRGLVRVFNSVELFASKGAARFGPPVTATRPTRDSTLTNSVSAWMQKHPANSYWIKFSFVIDSDRKVSKKQFKRAITAFTKNFKARFPGSTLASTSLVTPLDIRVRFKVTRDQFVGLDDERLMEELEYRRPNSGVHVYRCVTLLAHTSQDSLDDPTDFSFVGRSGTAVIGTAEQLALQNQSQERLFKGDRSDIMSS